MVNIVSTSIDSRLIHRQITGQWLSKVGVNTLLVINHSTAKDTLRQELMKSMIPTICLKFYTVDEAYVRLCKTNNAQKIALVCANPYDVLKLVEAGISIPKVTIGYMGMKDGKRQVTSNIAVDEQDLSSFRKLQKLHIVLELSKFLNSELKDITQLLEYKW